MPVLRHQPTTLLGFALRIATQHCNAKEGFAHCTQQGMLQYHNAKGSVLHTARYVAMPQCTGLCTVHMARHAAAPQRNATGASMTVAQHTLYVACTVLNCGASCRCSDLRTSLLPACLSPLLRGIPSCSSLLKQCTVSTSQVAQFAAYPYHCPTCSIPYCM